jgi:hypothetical protein
MMAECGIVKPNMTTNLGGRRHTMDFKLAGWILYDFFMHFERWRQEGMPKDSDVRFSLSAAAVFPSLLLRELSEDFLSREFVAASVVDIAERLAITQDDVWRALYELETSEFIEYHRVDAGRFDVRLAEAFIGVL